jgi:hypothetical protein
MIGKKANKSPWDNTNVLKVYLTTRTLQGVIDAERRSGPKKG